jgi:hypothetical protein
MKIGIIGAGQIGGTLTRRFRALDLLPLLDQVIQAARPLLVVAEDVEGEARRYRTRHRLLPCSCRSTLTRWLLAKKPRHLAVLNLAAEKAGWDKSRHSAY